MADPARRRATHDDVLTQPVHVASGTEDLDRTEKRPVRARSRVAHVWLVDPL
jgi:hypothetical protein